MSQAKNPFGSGEAEALLRDKGRLKKLLQSQEAKKLVELLQNQNGGALRKAAQAAQKGDCSGLNTMLQNLMKTGEGSKLAEQLSTEFSPEK